MTQHDLYLAAIDLSEARALVVGGDAVAAEKIAGLRASGASIRVVTPAVAPQVEELLDSGTEWIEREYRASDLDGCLLVIVTTGDCEFSERVANDARARNMLVNVADVPRLCNFILPAIARQGPIAIAVSTSGTSPALAQRIRREISGSIGTEYGELAVELAALREWARSHLDTYDRRKAFFDSIVNAAPDPIDLVRLGDKDRLHEMIEEAKRTAVEGST
ncbi:MAG: bifunctional precorrin-2 dehydrogenase/sirohydrochlorin ferrochelatase [Actinomycetota bacterium]|nr:bifunctional precorrin-2 dehydrogenase/sirohydrochlorin ferrochelatase [Actinomycetota bacterium]